MPKSFPLLLLLFYLIIFSGSRKIGDLTVYSRIGEGYFEPDNSTGYFDRAVIFEPVILVDSPVLNWLTGRLFFNRLFFIG